MLPRHYQHLQREEGEDFGLELVLRGTRERLTPIVMTAVITALAILPLAVALIKLIAERYLERSEGGTQSKLPGLARIIHE